MTPILDYAQANADFLFLMLLYVGVILLGLGVLQFRQEVYRMDEIANLKFVGMLDHTMDDIDAQILSLKNQLVNLTNFEPGERTLRMLMDHTRRIAQNEADVLGLKNVVLQPKKSPAKPRRKVKRK